MSYIPALSVMQPWTWLMVNGFKKIENRSRRFHYRGPLLLHAGLKVDQDAHDDIANRRHPASGEPTQFLPAPPIGFFDRGGIVGICDLVDCVEASDDPFFVGTFGLVIANARPLRFQPCRGMLGLFDPKITVDLSPI